MGFAIAVRLGVGAHRGIGIGRGLDLGFHQGDRDRAAHVHLATRRAVNFVVGPDLEQTFQRQVGAVAHTGQRVAVHAGIDVGACAADHTATTTLGVEPLQVGACQVVGGQHAQAVGHQLGAVQHTGRGRAIEGGMGHSTRCTKGRGCGREAVHVVAHLARGAHVGVTAHRQRVAAARAQIGRDRLVVVHARFGARAGDQATRTCNGLAVNAFIASGRDLQDPTHQTFELVGLCGHGGVAGGLGNGHTNAHIPPRTNTGGKGLGFHRINGADAHIARGGQQRLTCQDDLGRAPVF